MTNLLRSWLGCSAVLAAGAASLSCASYAKRTARALDDFQAGRFERAAQAFSDVRVTGSTFLSGAEAGTVWLAGGSWGQALEELERAAQAVAAFEEQALVSPGSVARGAASLVTNESAMDYKGEGYERVQLHTGMALAYLALGRLEDAMVEVRRANQLLESEETLYRKQYRAGGLGHFLSAVVYDLTGEADQAYIDWLRLEEKGLAAKTTGASLVRLARLLGREEDLARHRERYGDVAPVPPGSARVVLVAGVGLAPYKVAATLTIPLPYGLVQFSVPDYIDRPQPVTSLELRAGEGLAGSEAIEDVGRVARENLSDRLAWLATKSAARGVAKHQLTRELEQEHGLIGRLLGDVFAFASERADVRCWHSLPATWQVARIEVPAGRHAVTLAARAGPRAHLGTYELDAGETMFVFARSVGERLFAHTVGGLRIRPPDSPEPPEPYGVDSGGTSDADPRPHGTPR